MTLGTDDWSALRLQMEWGADEALSPDPIDRLLPADAPNPARQPINRPRPISSGTTPSSTPLSSPSPPASGTPAAGTPAAGTPAEQAVAAAGAAGTLEALRAAIAGFDLCPLKQTASHLVFAEGNPESPVLLIGDPPGREEDRTGHPFAGPEGQLLDRMLGSIGLPRDTLMLTPLIPWRPPGGRPVNAGELALLLPFLHRLIALLQPARVLILGGVAARALLGQPPRRQAAAAWVEMRTPGLATAAQALMMPALAEMLKKPPLRREAWRALRMLRRALDAIPTQN